MNLLTHVLVVNVITLLQLEQRDVLLDSSVLRHIILYFVSQVLWAVTCQCIFYETKSYLGCNVTGFAITVNCNSHTVSLMLWCCARIE